MWRRAAIKSALSPCLSFRSLFGFRLVFSWLERVPLLRPRDREAKGGSGIERVSREKGVVSSEKKRKSEWGPKL